MENKLFVGNLPWAATEEDIRAHFAQFGDVTTVEVMRDKFTGRARGFAFVTMASNEHAQAAIAKTEGFDFMGRPLKVNVARPREERPAFGGGDRGGESFVVPVIDRGPFANGATFDLTKNLADDLGVTGVDAVQYVVRADLKRLATPQNAPAAR